MIDGYTRDVSVPTEAWDWRTVVLFPVQLLALAWSLPVVVLLMLAPFAVAFWLGRAMLAGF